MLRDGGEVNVDSENERQMDVAAVAEKTDAPTAGWLLKGGAVLVMLPNLALGAMTQAIRAHAAVQTANLPMLAGGAIGYALLAPLAFVLLFQIFPRFRNERSRWRIFLVTSLLLLLGTIGSLGQAVQGG